jgi:hypothetical protein
VAGRGKPPHPRRDVSLDLFKRGLCNSEIAEQLDTSYSNVKNWRNHFHGKGLLAGVRVVRNHPDDGRSAAELWKKYDGPAPYALCGGSREAVAA